MEDSAKGFIVKYETVELEQLESLFIYEKGDETTGEVSSSRDNNSQPPLLKENHGQASDGDREERENSDTEEQERAGKTGAAVHDVRVQTQEEDERQMESKKETMELCEKEVNEKEETEGKVEDDGETVGEVEKMVDERPKDQGSAGMEMESDQEREQQTEARFEKVEGTTGGIHVESTGETKLEDNTGLQVAVEPSSMLKPKDRLSPLDAEKRMRRLTPDFPDSLYELLCTLQEGRRLNDQRCSFMFERRCHSEPSTPVPRHKVIFSSMTSLQKEEFFDLLATTQGRRLDDQRAELQNAPPRHPLPPNKVSRKKNSLKVAVLKEVPIKPAAKEELYDMILTSQAQGRLEDQRSAAPGPMDDEDFFSLLLKVQGGRIDEQRTELPLTFKH